MNTVLLVLHNLISPLFFFLAQRCLIAEAQNPLIYSDTLDMFGIVTFVWEICLLANSNVLTHQWRHVSSVHLPCGDLLLGRGHCTHIESFRAADGPRPNYTWKCH